MDLSDFADLVLAPSDTGQSAINTAPLGAAGIVDLNSLWGTPSTGNRFKSDNTTGVGGAVYFTFMNAGSATAYIRFRQRSGPGATPPTAGTTASNGVPIPANGRLDLWVPYSLSFLDVFGTGGTLVFWASSFATG